jgi:hypothetical protein
MSTAIHAVHLAGVGPVEMPGHPVADFFSLTMEQGRQLKAGAA